MRGNVLARRVGLMAGWGGLAMLLLQEMAQQTNRDFVLTNAQPFAFFLATAFAGAGLVYLSTWNGRRAETFETLSASMLAFNLVGLLIALLLGGALHEVSRV